jgi:hypothetical protein
MNLLFIYLPLLVGEIASTGPSLVELSGGNGDPAAHGSVGEGHCVPDGSFSDLKLKLIDGDDGSKPKEHCISHAFDKDDIRGDVARSTVSMKAMRESIRQPEFSCFLAKLDAGPSATILQWIDGEFTQLTAPKDPFFILHLA